MIFCLNAQLPFYKMCIIIWYMNSNITKQLNWFWCYLPEDRSQMSHIKGSVLQDSPHTPNFRCQSQVQTVTCASDQAGYKLKVSTHPPQDQLIWEMWRARPIKYIKQNGVTHVNQDGCQSAMTFWLKRETTVFAVYNALPCIKHTHVLGPNFQGKKSFILIFLIQFFTYLYLSNKINYHNPGYYFAYGYHSAFRS